MDEFVFWLNQGEYRAVSILVVSIFVFLVSLSFVSKSFFVFENRSVNVGRDSHGPIMTGDINTNNSKSLLTTLVKVLTILASIAAIFSAYFAYLAL